jgi:hypothetical protein
VETIAVEITNFILNKGAIFFKKIIAEKISEVV